MCELNTMLCIGRGGSYKNKGSTVPPSQSSEFAGGDSNIHLGGF